MKQSTMVVVGLVVLVIIAGGAAALNKKDTNKSSSSTPTVSHQAMNMSSQNSSSSNTGSSNTNQSPAAATNVVKIENFEFSPKTINIKKGTTVTWKNNDETSHTVTADDNSFGSGTMNHNDTFSFTFKTAGSFKYHCNFHSSMTATVVVTE